MKQPRSVYRAGLCLLSVFALCSMSLPGSTGSASTYAGSPTSTVGLLAARAASLGVFPTSVVGGTMAQGEVFLSEPAPSGGAVVFLSTNSPFASVPAKVKIGTRGTSATFNIKTRQVASQTAVTISATYGVTVSAVLTITPRTTALSSVTVNPTTVVGGNTAQGTATLSGAAPTGGLIVTLASANPSVVGVPPSVTVTAGSSSANFNVTTSQVGSSTSTSISGTYGGTASTSITVVPAAAGLSSVRVDPTTVVGGNTALGTVNLTGAAPTGGLTVSLASDNPSVAGVPASATVPAGSASTNFNVTTTTVLSGG